jgi:predicted methyltransferase
MPFAEAARSMRPAASLALDMLDAAAAITDTAPGAGEPTEILAPYDQPIDELLVPAAALAAYGDAEDLRHLGVTVGLLAAATSEQYQQRTQVMDALLARAVRIVSARACPQPA